MPELQVFAKNVWIVAGHNVRDFGIMFSTRMVVVKLADGSLWVNSPVSVPFDTLERISKLGPVRYLVAATPRHVWRLKTWHTLFPEAQLWASRFTPFTLKKGRLPFTGILKNVPNHAWADDFDQLAFEGNPLIEEVLFLHKESHTVILDDLIQIHPTVKGKPFLGNRWGHITNYFCLAARQIVGHPGLEPGTPLLLRPPQMHKDPSPSSSNRCPRFAVGIDLVIVIVILLIIGRSNGECGDAITITSKITITRTN